MELQLAISYPAAGYVDVPYKQLKMCCPHCGKALTPSGYRYHMKAGHLQGSGKLCVKIGAQNQEKWILESFNALTDSDQRFFQIVIIPWYSREEKGDEIMRNVSVGATSVSNLEMYANRIWSSIQQALNNGSASLIGCGSGRVAANRLNWFMRPAEVFGISLYGIGTIVQSKVKGFVRELIGAVHTFSASDEFGYLDNCHKHIIRQVELSLGFMADINEETFDRNTLNLAKNRNDPKQNRVIQS